MKLALLLVAGAAAVAPPRIELNLETLTSGTAELSRDTSYAPHNPPALDHDNNGIYQPDGTRVMSRQDWTERCPANAAYDELTQNGAHPCPHPEAQAYDHNDKAVTVTRRIYLVNYNGKTEVGVHGGSSVALPLKVDAVEYAARATYLFKYDAQDGAGNHAEQVVFALELDDTTKPQVFPCGCGTNGCDDGEHQTLRAATEDKYCGGSAPGVAGGDQAGDNCIVTDGTQVCSMDPNPFTPSAAATATIRYTIKHCAMDDSDPPQPLIEQEGGTDTNRCLDNESTEPTTIISNAKYAEAMETMGTLDVGAFEITIRAWDSAGVYGAGCNGVDGNNCAIRQTIVHVTDEVAPQIHPNGAQKVYHECATDYEDANVVVTDNLDTVLQQPVAKSLAGSVDQNVVTGENKDYETLETSADDYQLTYTARDKAANPATPYTRTVRVVDRTPPTVHLNPSTMYCDEEGVDCEQTDFQWRITDPDAPEHTAFVDPGATATDTCDTSLDGSTDFNGVFDRDHGDFTKLGTYTLTYTQTDANGNDATPKTRQVTFIDRQAPQINPLPMDCTDCVEDGIEIVEARNPDCTLANLPANQVQSCTYSEPTGANGAIGAACHDFVNGTINGAVIITGDDVDFSVTSQTRGSDYVVVYNCMDASKNRAQTKRRTIRVVDTQKPEITLSHNDQCKEADGAHCYLEAGFAYEEAGAIATDSLDGTITDSIQIDGQVNTDVHWYGLRSCQEIKEEAQRQYAREAAKGEDAATAAQIATTVNDGMYWITTAPSDDSLDSTMHPGNRVQVWCDMANDGPANRRAMTYFYCEGCDAVTPYDGNVNTGFRQGSCVNAGAAHKLQMAAWLDASEADQFAKNKAKTHFTEGKVFLDGSNPFPTAGATTNYLCTVPLNPTYPRGAMNLKNADKIAGREATHIRGVAQTSSTVAEAGSYIVTYTVRDLNDNAQATAGGVKRTVVVKDTLPPVISLHMLNADGGLTTAFHVSKGDQVSKIDGETVNPAGDPEVNDHLKGATTAHEDFNPAQPTIAFMPGTVDETREGMNLGINLMAEQRSAAGGAWLAAAGAAAVAGVALLAVAARKQEAVATSVPV